jgi:hypothetical protein
MAAADDVSARAKVFWFFFSKKNSFSLLFHCSSSQERWAEAHPTALYGA